MPTPLQHQRNQNLLLISKILSSRDNVSPFNLVLDSLEQSAKPLVRECVQRAKAAKVSVLWISYETLRKPNGADVFIDASMLNAGALQKEIVQRSSGPNTKELLIFDNLNSLSSTLSLNLPAFLSSLITQTRNLVAVYHLDVPISTLETIPYSPEPIRLLKYLATTIMTLHSFHHILAQKAARDRSLQQPVFGLEQEHEGITVGRGANDGNERRGLVIEMEHRRKSGRAVEDWFFLPWPQASRMISSTEMSPQSLDGAPKTVADKKMNVMLLEDHPLYRQQDPRAAEVEGEDGMDTTFNLGLTEKQRRDREGVVLPYFDAQKGEGGEGGRILYDMGEEDDFDEEEDEI